MRTLTDEILFDNFNLLSISNVHLSSTDPNRFPTRKVHNSPLANTDGSVTTSAFFEGRVVNISLYITELNRELLDDAISTLRRRTNGVNKTLKMPISSAYRNFYNVTLQNMAISNIKGSYAEINLEFLASDPFSYDVITTEVQNVLNLTSGDKSYPIYLEGTAPQLPVITYTLDSFTGSNGINVTFTNPATSTSITVSRSWTAADVLVVDCFNHTVEVNGDPVEFTGNFLEFTAGDQHFNYTDGFTERQVDINFTYRKRYY